MTTEPDPKPTSFSPGDPRQGVARKTIVELRRRLLDLTNRNQLLNFRFSSRSRTHVRVVDELPDFLFGKLNESKPLTFQGLPEPETAPADEKTLWFSQALAGARSVDEEYSVSLEKLADDDDETSPKGQKIERALKDRVREQLGMPVRPARETMTPAEYAKAKKIDPDYDLPLPAGDGEDKKAHQDKLIQTLLFPDQMERKLSGVRDGARSARQEMGVEILFAAFGYLEWYESPGSNRKLFAPLMLLPVQMDRKLLRHTYRYSISGTGDEATVNIALRERLRADFGFELPDLEPDDTPESYLLKIETALADKSGDKLRWRLRRFVVVGLFSFARLAMYQDLDPERWGEGVTLHDHAVALALLGGTDKGQSLLASDYDVDDPEIARKVPLLITDADSSQFSSIADVMDGRNLAIKGPPGTGKSQTITNLIAAALATGKTVLFVAEKMAALEVVKKRLDDAGIGDFCLELHSTKAHKKDVVESLKARREIERVVVPWVLEQKLEALSRCRSELTDYATVINEPIGDTGLSLHDHVWACLAAGDRCLKVGLPESLDSVVLDDAWSLRVVDCERRRETLASLENRVRAIRSHDRDLADHPWNGLRAATLNPFQQQELLGDFRRWKDVLSSLERGVAELTARWGMPELATRRHLRDCLAVGEVLVGGDPALLRVLEHLPDVDAIAQVTRFVETQKDFRVGVDRITEVVAMPLSAIDLDALARLRTSALHLTESASLGKARVGSLSAEADADTERATDCRHAAGLAATVFVEAGLMIDPTPASLLAILDALQLCRSVSATVIARRSPSLIGRAAAETLQQARTEADDIKRAAAELSERLVPVEDVDAATLRAMAATVRSASFLQRWFGAEYKQARKTWRAARRDSARASTSEMAEDLETVANLVVRIEGYRRNNPAARMCSESFRGIDTDFGAFEAVNRFGDSVHSRFGGIEPAHVAIRTFLLEAPSDKIDRILSIVDEGTSAELASLLASAPVDLGEVGVGFEEVKSSFVDRGRVSAELSGLAAKLSVQSDVTLENLPSVVSLVEQTLEQQSRLEHDEFIRNALGDEQFSGADGDYPVLPLSVESAREIVSRAPVPGFAAWLLQPGLRERAAALGDTTAAWAEQLQREEDLKSRCLEGGEIAEREFFDAMLLETSPIHETVERIGRAIDAESELEEWVDLNRQSASASELGLGPVLKCLETEGRELANLGDAFSLVFHRSVLRTAYGRRPLLQKFSGLGHEAVRRQFAQLDRETIQLKRTELAARLSEATIDVGNGSGARSTWTGLAVVDNEISKKKRHIPLRDLLSRAGQAIQDMKPCWMMSPPSIAQFLDPTGVHFDLVVIDEASQMKPEDALGALGRGQQLVVVGDPQQLPPSSFFDRLEDGDGEDDADDRIDSESILDLALATFQPARNLRWHYRSRHESLIEFSNRQFYDNQLVLFPAANARGADLGVEYRFVEGRYTPRISTNLLELSAVVDAAIDFMRTSAANNFEPLRSLGIVTINQAQRDVVLEEIDRRCADDKLADDYRKFWEPTLEPLFVKNLENVQGDERDVIFVSTVYGPDATTGNVAQRFGPINSQAGHRRLNVLFTRAKEKIVLFSSMRFTDVRPREQGHRGVRVLKDYLNYAETGQIDAGVLSGREPDSDFERFVADALRDRGYQVVPQVGVEGFYIDLGIIHPKDPTSFILGVECDGATYHSSKSARDRDRLREEVLEKLGWSLYRIWSTDWFASPRKEVDRLVAHLETLVG